MNKEVMESIIAMLAGIPMFAVLIIFALIALAVGVFMGFRPALAIEIQRRLYYRINWKIEPVSMPKEIRNTRIMGWFLLILSVTTFLLSFAKTFR